MKNERIKIIIKGQVQGVGFRPYVYNLAIKYGLCGWVKNGVEGVVIEVQGERTKEFIKTLQKEPPPLANIDSFDFNPIPPKRNENDFKILSSVGEGNVTAKILPDVGICQDCLSELFDPASGYYRYPFLNCTNCGPRFTITKSLPYDRAKTAMSDFPLCLDCESEYLDPTNRRYHAQPTACHKCGPSLSHSIDEIKHHIESGKIVALKGLGGYQLICDAKNENTIKILRKRKNRQSKPFALMALNVESINQWASCNDLSKVLLQTWQRPIVLLPKAKKRLPDIIAPGLSHLGFMLPYTPFHYLIFNSFVNNPNGLKWLDNLNDTVLIVTSANPGSVPLITDDDEAVKLLGDIADVIVPYNREIITRADDSVANITNEKPLFIRRARGYIPNSIFLDCHQKNVLALGAYLKNTFCVTRGNEAFVSQHIGDLDNAKTIEFFHESIDHLLKTLDVKPEVLAHDLHPDFYTTHYANSSKLPTIAVQHHEAHFAAVMAEHKLTEPTLGLILDGYGYGHDGTSWGGELFLYDQKGFKRIGHLKSIMQPGGDKAASEAWRMCVSVLNSLGLTDEIYKLRYDSKNVDLLLQMMSKDINSPMTTSCGRLFDAASAVLGITQYSNYEGQAAMMLESLVTRPKVLQDAWCIIDNQLDILPIFQTLLRLEPEEGANLFHGTLIAAITQWIEQNSVAFNINKIILSGGCFLNRVLTEGLIQSFHKKGLTPVLPKQLPPNDGAISLGQAWIANLTMV